jgi:hypothetical protein
VQLQPEAAGATSRKPSAPASGRGPKQMKSGTAGAPGLVRTHSVRHALSPHAPASTREYAAHEVSVKRDVKAGLHLGSPDWEVGGRVVLLQTATCTTEREGPSSPTREHIPTKQIQTSKAGAPLMERAGRRAMPTLPRPGGGDTRLGDGVAARPDVGQTPRPSEGAASRPGGGVAKRSGRWEETRPGSGGTPSAGRSGGGRHCAAGRGEGVVRAGRMGGSLRTVNVLTRKSVLRRRCQTDPRRQIRASRSTPSAAQEQGKAAHQAGRATLCPERLLAAGSTLRATKS